MTDQPINFEQDVKRYPDFIKLLEGKEFCAQLWTAFANVNWYKKFDPLLSETEQVMDVLVDDIENRTWGASFRGMGGVIADLRNEFYDTNEDYMDWYCSNLHYDSKPYGYVSEAITKALTAIGWYPVKDEYYKDANKQ
jgi:hypothetical protein